MNSMDGFVNFEKQLNAMYENHYCIDSGFCKCYPNCSGGIAEQNKFYSDRAKTGEKYGNDPSTPKIVFAGLEGIRPDVVGRVQEIDMSDETSKPSLDATNNHYRGVRYVLAYLMRKFEGAELPKNAGVNLENNYIGEIDDQEYLKSFCLTNLYKCAFGSNGKKSALTHSKGMKDNCYKIFLDEINILRPDILVIQVVSNRPPKLWDIMKKEYYAKLIKGDENKNNTSVYKLIYPDNHIPFYCVWTYHGNGAPYYRREGGVFVNNPKYIENELNPVLDATIKELKNDSRLKRNF